MKLKKTFIPHETKKESMLVPMGGAGFSGLVKGNKTFGAILELLKTDTTEEKLIADMKAQFDAPDGAIERDVKEALTELRKIGAIED